VAGVAGVDDQSTSTGGTFQLAARLVRHAVTAAHWPTTAASTTTTTLRRRAGSGGAVTRHADRGRAGRAQQAPLTRAAAPKTRARQPRCNDPTPTQRH